MDTWFVYQCTRPQGHKYTITTIHEDTSTKVHKYIKKKNIGQKYTSRDKNISLNM